jgi:KilA-N domain
MMGDNNLMNIIFEDINEQYSYGKYGEFDVIIMRSNGYINATKLYNEGGKMFKNWLPNKTFIELVKAISKSIDVPTTQLIIKNGIGLNKIRGSYVHPTLITHIAY